METLVILVIAAFFGWLVGARAQKLNRNPWGWGLTAWLISPLLIWIILEICGKKRLAQSHDEVEETVIEGLQQPALEGQ